MRGETGLRCVLLAVAGLGVGSAAAQVVTDPNQVVGSFRWTNARPEIRELIDRRALSDRYRYRIRAESVGLDPAVTASASGSDRDREIPAYEISVESDSAGLVHELRGEVYDFGHDRYWFAPRLSAPVFPEPAPDVELQFQECAGALRILLPEGVSDGLAEADLLTAEGGRQALLQFDDATATEQLFLLRGDERFDVTVTFHTGTDPDFDRLRWEFSFSDLAVGCDEIVELDCSGSGSGPEVGLGAIVGRFDVLGEHELAHDSGALRLSLISAAEGPWRNSRAAALPGDPSAGPFELPNLMPSTVTEPPEPYSVRARAVLRGGRTFEGPHLDVLVGDGESVELGEAFVFRPGRITGGVFLDGPPREPPLDSPLRWLRTSTPPDDPDWIPPNGRLPDTLVAVRGTAVVPPGATRPTRGAEFEVEPRGSWLEASASWEGPYELPVAALSGEPGHFDASHLRLRFRGPNDSDEPDTWLDSTAWVDDDGIGSRTVAPDEMLEIDRRYCFSQVTVGFTTLSGELYRPSLSFDGELAGRDQWGRPRAYSVDGSAHGTPPSAIAPAPTGQVIAALPAGRYELTPRLTHVSDSGQDSQLRLEPLDLAIGCRQRLVLQPELALGIGLDDVPPCAEAGSILLTGRVTSDEPVVSVTAAVNAGPDQVLCSDCGISPDFAGSVALQDGGNEVVVTATDASGRTASVEAFSRHATEPSALDRRPASPPLRVRREAGGLRLSWEDLGPANLHSGSLEALWTAGEHDHSALGACGRTGGSARIESESGARYFLVTSPCEWGEGSFGRDSLGRERPGSRRPCE